VAPPARARVATAPVQAEVTSVPVDEKAPEPKDVAVPKGGEVVQTAPAKVDGFGTVGVTWKPGTRLEDDDIKVQARTYADGHWSDWSEVKYEEAEGPDPTSAEGRAARPGTDPLVVGDVDKVQTRVVTAPGVETPDLQMAVVEPGDPAKTAVESPTITTGEASKVPADVTLPTDQGDVKLQADTTVPRPMIYSRAQWGADESLRKGTVSYGTIAAGFIHHTVNSNTYTADQVPGIIRSIYAYHTQTKGWNDIGYNFLIDRLGRIWEGRYGGVDKAVVGAHTEGYNSYSFAASAIGNYEEVQPSAETLDAYARLYAWKLSMYGIAADDTSQWVGSKYFQAINGHRDAGQTACPGKYMYAKIPDIRVAARKYQLAGGAAVVPPTTAPTPTPTPTPTPVPVNGTARVPDIAGAAFPDLVARRASDGAAVVLPTGGLLSFGAPATVSTGWSRYNVKVLSPDLNGDGRSDMVVRIAKSGIAGVRPGRGDGTFGTAITPLKTFVGYDLVTPVGTFNGDRNADLVARRKSTGDLVLFRGNGAGGFSRVKLAGGFGSVNRLVATGDVSGDGKADLLARSADGRMRRYNGDGAGHLGAGRLIPGTWNYPTVTGMGDLTGDGPGDLLVRDSAGALWVAPGNGTGSFGQLVPVDGSIGNLAGVAVAPVSGSPEPDLVGFAGDALVMATNTGRTNVGRAIPAGPSFALASQVLNVGDWDGDRHGDVITRQTDGTLVLYRGTGTGTLAAGTLLDSRDFHAVSMLTAAGDVNGDGKPDLTAVKGGQLVLYPGNGRAALGTAKVLNPSVSGSALLDLGRWDANGTLDTGILSASGLAWLPGNLGTPKPLAADLSGLSGVFAAGDVTGDGRPDLIGRSEPGKLWLLPGTASGFGARRYLGTGFAGYDLLG
jgi:hypothetical protein